MFNPALSSRAILRPLMSSRRRLNLSGAASGFIWKPPNNQGAASDYSAAAGRTIFQPFYCPPDINLADFKMAVTSKASVASARCMLALYLFDEAQLKPTTRLAVSGNLDISTSTTTQYLDLVGLSLPSDQWYCQAISFDTPVATVQGNSAVWSIDSAWGCNASAIEYVACYKGPLTYGTATLTDPAPDLSSYSLQVNAIQPMICFVKR